MPKINYLHLVLIVMMSILANINVSFATELHKEPRVPNTITLTDIQQKQMLNRMKAAILLVSGEVPFEDGKQAVGIQKREIQEDDPYVVLFADKNRGDIGSVELYFDGVMRPSCVIPTKIDLSMGFINNFPIELVDQSLALPNKEQTVGNGVSSANTRYQIYTFHYVIPAKSARTHSVGVTFTYWPDEVSPTDNAANLWLKDFSIYRRDL